MAINYNPPEWIAGDSESLAFIIADDRGVPIDDITDWTGSMAIRKTANGLVLASSAAVIDTTLKSMTFNFTPTQTAAFRAAGDGDYLYDAESVQPDGTVTTEVRGVIPIVGDITRVTV